ncbi:hypothetical protein BMR60_26815 [Escherichia coli]|uniref:YdiL family protein n=1 Tax=Escherichia coli TaxID=562 RepID=UPI000BDEBF4B|nr:YdiL family protein [Escherichia coli]PCS94004.1 hypothetical protein BMR60_26815 [Escherichia coli]
MNAYELQALRHIFAMTIDECATWIAQTGDSESWRQWENGKCAIPDRVVEQLLAMRQQRKKHLHAIIEKINNRIGNNTMRFFPDLTAFQRVYPDGNFIDWKGSDSNLLIVFYVQIMPDDLVMQLHRF